jgi:hypothetical protein
MQTLSDQVTREAIQCGIDAFVVLPTLTLISPEPVLDSLRPFVAPPGACAPIYAVGDFVEFQLPDRAFTVYAFGEVRSVRYAPLYAIVTPAANYYTVSGDRVRMRDTTESLSSEDESTLEWVATQGGSASPEYVVGDLVSAMLPDRVRNVFVHARITEVIRGVSYGVLSFHGNHFHVFEQDMRLMTEQDLLDLCDGEPELAHARMTDDS